MVFLILNIILIILTLSIGIPLVKKDWDHICTVKNMYDEEDIERKKDIWIYMLKGELNSFEQRFVIFIIAIISILNNILMQFQF